MLQPSINTATFRAKPAYRDQYRFIHVQSPAIGTNGIAATGNLRVIIPKGRNKLIVGDASLVALVAAAAATYTITVGRRTAAGVDIPLTTAQSVLAAGITALGGLNRTNTLPQVTTLTDVQRTVMPDDILYVDLAITTLTTQPTMVISVDAYVQE